MIQVFYIVYRNVLNQQTVDHRIPNDVITLL